MGDLLAASDGTHIVARVTICLPFCLMQWHIPGFVLELDRSFFGK